MTTIIPFRQRRSGGPTVEIDQAAPAVRPEEAMVGSHARDAELERHWGVALALASWPLCLGASVVLATL